MNPRVKYCIQTVHSASFPLFWTSKYIYLIIIKNHHFVCVFLSVNTVSSVIFGYFQHGTVKVYRKCSKIKLVNTKVEKKGVKNHPVCFIKTKTSIIKVYRKLVYNKFLKLWGCVMCIWMASVYNVICMNFV